MTERDQSRALEALRVEIDAVDDQILALLNQRAQIAGRIGQHKAGVLYRPEREAQVLRRLRESNPGPLRADSLAYLFREIMSVCLAYERPVTVACLGPSGTYSEAAVVQHFGHAVRSVLCANWNEVLRSAEAGKADFALVPVENSSEGAVGHTLDLLIETPLQVCAEVLLRVRQQLLALPETTELRAIEQVFSHSQSLGQCQNWLNANLPQARHVPVSSNAEAARLASSTPHSAAIAGLLAGERHGLRVLQGDIEDESGNTTRFLVCGNLAPAPSGQDKTSVVLALKNRPGAIHDLLTPLSQLGVSLTRLESRPARTGLWEYVFFLDLEGHRQLDPVAQAIQAMAQRALFCKVLGSYPVALS